MAKNLPIRVKYGIIGALLNYMRSTIMHKNRMRAKNRGGGAVICRERRRSRRSRTMCVPHRTERKRIGSGGIPAAGTGDAGGSKGQAGMRHSAAAKDVYRRIHNERIEENRA